MYKIFNNRFGELAGVLRLKDEASIPIDPANTDYQAFKTQINAGEAELEDAEGVLMTSQQAKDFVATLP